MLMMSCRAPPCGSSDRMDNKEKKKSADVWRHTRGLTLPGATHAPINHKVKHTAEKKALAFRSGHQVQQFTECLCVFVFGVCVCVCVCTYSGGGKKMPVCMAEGDCDSFSLRASFSWRKVCLLLEWKVDVCSYCGEHTNTHPDAHEHNYTIKERRTCLHKLKLTFKLHRCASINVNLNHG